MLIFVIISFFFDEIFFFLYSVHQTDVVSKLKPDSIGLWIITSPSLLYLSYFIFFFMKSNTYLRWCHAKYLNLTTVSHFAFASTFYEKQISTNRKSMNCFLFFFFAYWNNHEKSFATANKRNWISNKKKNLFRIFNS